MYFPKPKHNTNLDWVENKKLLLRLTFYGADHISKWRKKWKVAVVRKS